jgi:YHS domain-containing protein
LTQPFPLAYDGTRTIGTNGFSSRMMRFLIWLVVLCWTVAMLRRAVAWVLHGFSSSVTNQQSQQGPANQQPTVSSRRLVRDPVCGMHVAEERAIPLQIEGELVHFCSPACRDQYARDNQKFAANG